MNYKNKSVPRQHMDVRKGDHRDVVKALLDVNADKDTSYNNGTTPLHIASERGLKDIVKILISNPSASKEKSDNRGYTPLLDLRTPGWYSGQYYAPTA